MTIFDAFAAVKIDLIANYYEIAQFVRLNKRLLRWRCEGECPIINFIVKAIIQTDKSKLLQVA